MRAYVKRVLQGWSMNRDRLPGITWDRRTRQVKAISIWIGLEALPPRVMLDASPYGLSSFKPLGDSPVVIAGPIGLNGAPLMDLNADGMGDLIVEYGNGTGAGNSTVAAVSALLMNADGSSREYRIARYAIPPAAPLPVINQVLVGDFNGDGRPDVAVLHNNGAVLTTHKFIDIFLCQADGTFTQPNASIDLGSAIATPTMSLLDQNGDGKMDVFLEDGTKFTAFPGNGDGTFASPVVTDFLLQGFKLSSVTNTSFQQDLNGDGIPDLVVSGLIPAFVQSGNKHALYVFKGQASGGYNLTPSFSDVTNDLTLLDLRQLSSDTKPEIVAYATLSGSQNSLPTSLFVFRNNGSGAYTQSFHSPTFANGLPTIVLGQNNPMQPLLTPDLTNDGIADMILVEGPGASHVVTLHIEKNNGSAGFTETQQFNFTSMSYDSKSLVTDVDGDGLPDLVVYNFTGNGGGVTTTIYFNHGGGTFDAQGLVPSPSSSVTAGSYPGLADFNHDGKLDLVYTGFSVAEQKPIVEVLLNATGRTFSAPVDTLITNGIVLSQSRDIPPDPLRDYTGDSLPDLLVYSNNAGGTVAQGLSILASSSDGHFTFLNPPITFGNVQVIMAPIVTDFNHDGKLDLLWGDSTGFSDNVAGGLFVDINGVSAPVDTAGANIATARDLGTLTGPAALTEFVNTSVTTQPLDMLDFYKFTLSAPQTVRIAAMPAVGKVSLVLDDSGGSGLGFSNATLPFIDATLAAGTYYVGVEHSGSADTSYRLDIEFPTAAPVIGVLQGFTTIISGQNTPVDFGDVKTTTTDTHKVFTIRNEGSGTLNLGDINFPAGFALDGAAPSSLLAPGASTTMSVVMNTATPGQYSGNIEITSGNPLVTTFLIPVSGSVTGPVLSDLSGQFASSPAMPASIIAGQSAPLSFTLSNAGPGEADGSYSVAFKLEKGAAQLGKGDVAAGTASGGIVLATGATTASIGSTLNVPGNLAPGTYYLAATITHGGGDIDTNNADKTFFSGPITVGLPPTHLVFVNQPSATIAGQVIGPVVTVQLLDSANNVVTADNSSVTIAMTVNPNNATLNGTTTVSAVNGIATFNDLSLNTAGTYTLTATQGALTSPKSSTISVTPNVSSAMLLIAHQPDATTVGSAMTPSLTINLQDQFGNIINTGTYATSTVTLAIAGGPAGGTFNGNSTLIAKAIKGVATFSKATLSMAGNYTLGVTDGTLGVANPVQFTQTITQGVSTITAPHPAASYTLGQTIALTSSLKSTAPTSIPFTGMASIVDQNEQVLGTAAIGTNGAIKFAFTSPAPGSYLSTISYPGDTNHTEATSPAFTLLINKAATKTLLAASASTLVFGQPLTLTATVSSTTAPGTPRTGSINFFDGATLLQNVVLDGNSSASLTFTPNPVGKHSYTAVYSGDSNFTAGTSPALARTVAKDKTSIQLTLEAPAASPIPHNQTFSLDVHVALIAPGASTVTGNQVTIKDGSNILGTVNLDINGDATLPALNYTAAGTHNLTAIYAGDANTLAATSLVLKLIVT